MNRIERVIEMIEAEEEPDIDLVYSMALDARHLIKQIEAFEAELAEERAKGEGSMAEEKNSCCGHASDCSVHNEPAYPAGPCDCGLESSKAIGKEHTWRDISTAPKDGTEIFLYAKDCGLVEGYWDIWPDPEDSRWVGYRAFSVNATHWMPIPTPPQTDEGEKDE